MISFRNMLRRFRRPRGGEVAPDEILLDAHNLPQFDTQQFEGVIEKPITKRVIVLLGTAFVILGGVFVWRFASLQVAHGEQYATQSAQNRLTTQPVFADRGVIYDRNHTELAWNMPGSDVAVPERAYTDKSGVGHLLGYVKPPRKDEKGNYYRTHFNGIAGSEATFNAYLQGENGTRLTEKNAIGEVTSASVTQNATDGDNLTLSIDARIQEKLFELITETAEDHSFKGGAGAIMNVANGRLLALTSFPEYDPEVLSQGQNAEAIASYNEDKNDPFLNRAISGRYTPGSIVKPFVAVGALEEGVINPRTHIVSEGSIAIPNPYDPDEETVFTDWKAHGAVDMREAIAVSSNVYFYEIGGGYKEQEGMGVKAIEKYMRMFGIGSSTSLGIAREPQGVIPTPDWKEETFDGAPWRLGDTYNTAIGQYGFQVTPLQMVRATAAIANGGILRDPVVRMSRTGDGKSLPLSETHIKVVQEGMRQAVESGTAQGLNVPYTEVAAKTGTAEIDASKTHVNSWIIGFYPYEDPQYAFAVVMEEGPRKNTIGGLFVMRRLFDWMQREFGTAMPERMTASSSAAGRSPRRSN